MTTFKRFVMHVAITLFVFSIISLPTLSFAQKGLVPCGTTSAPTAVGKTGAVTVGTGIVTNPCTFEDLITLVNNIITFVLFKVTIPIVAVMFAYAGILLITSGGEAAHARTKAKEIFFDAAIGLLIAFLAYLIIKVILKTLGYQGAWIGF